MTSFISRTLRKLHMPDIKKYPLRSHGVHQVINLSSLRHLLKYGLLISLMDVTRWLKLSCTITMSILSNLEPTICLEPFRSNRSDSGTLENHHWNLENFKRKISQTLYLFVGTPLDKMFKLLLKITWNIVSFPRTALWILWISETNPSPCQLSTSKPSVKLRSMKSDGIKPILCSFVQEESKFLSDVRNSTGAVVLLNG